MMKLSFRFARGPRLPLLLAVVVLPLGLRAADAPASAPAAPDANTNAARIEFAATIFDFAKIIAGQSVRHDYYFTNTGTALLKINSVNASCGCTTAGEWTREVPPGGHGRIALQFNSGNFSGAVTKTANVACNDPATPNVTLQIKGTVWRPVEVSPPTAMLSVNSESVSNATTVVRVLNHAPEPLEVFAAISSNPQFAAEVRTNSPGQLYEVVVRSVPPLNVANPHGVISLKTSSTNTPVVSISAMCVVQPAVLISPPRVIIPGAKLTNDWTTEVLIHNGLSRPLQLSEAAVNVPGGRAELRETDPGRAFAVTLVVPPAAKNPGPAPELTLKSNFPDHPIIRVPILVGGLNHPVTLNAVPMAARATRELNSPADRRAIEPNPAVLTSGQTKPGDQPAPPPVIPPK